MNTVKRYAAWAYIVLIFGTVGLPAFAMWAVVQAADKIADAYRYGADEDSVVGRYLSFCRRLAAPAVPHVLRDAA